MLNVSLRKIWQQLKTTSVEKHVNTGALSSTMDCVTDPPKQELRRRNIQDSKIKYRRGVSLK